ncbi:gamt-a [Symbiodinium sp. CCMP2592]|nr:gamt-a [Symbiodinium sp. CCMP2592]
MDAADATAEVESQSRAAWEEAAADFRTLPGGGQGLSILGHDVMEDWEAPYMDALAAVATSVPGPVLEVGYGLGLSAAAIDQRGVEGHVILEANSEVLGRAELWAEEATCPTIVLGGFWQDLVGSMADGTFGGILFDAYPLSPGEAAGDGEVGAFFVEAARLLRPGGIFTFYFDAGRNWIECVRSFRLETVPKLRDAGFTKVEHEQVACTPRPGCTYFWKDRFLVPIATR